MNKNQNKQFSRGGYDSRAISCGPASGLILVVGVEAALDSLLADIGGIYPLTLRCIGCNGRGFTWEAPIT